MKQKLPENKQGDVINFAFLLKTYPNDYHYAVRLLKSFQRYNKDALKIFVAVPSGGEKCITKKLGGNISNIIFLNEEEFPYLVTEPAGGLSEGYVNQEIIKLSFWEKGLCKNYFNLDSDSFFIRNFYITDFMYDDEYPYTVCCDDMALKADPAYFHTFWEPREKALEKIKMELGLSGKELWTCHGFQTFHSKVLESFKREFMECRHYSYADLLQISPYEFSWYNYYLQKSGLIPLHMKGPVFRTFHMPEHYVMSCLFGTGIDDLSRGYAGVVLNSNFTNGRDDVYGDISGYRFHIPGKYRNFLARELLRSIAGECKKQIKKIAGR